MNDNVQRQYDALKKAAEEKFSASKASATILIQVGSATCENAAGAEEVADEISSQIKNSKRDDVYLKRVGCTGRCSREPIVSVFISDKEMVSYQHVNRQIAQEIFSSHVINNTPVEEHLLDAICFEAGKKVIGNKSPAQKQLAEHPITQEFLKSYAHMSFYCHQARIALRNAGIIDPTSIDEYICSSGFEALGEVLKRNDPMWVIEQINISKLRGRGGGGFPTGKKWEFARLSEEKIRYIICNADEGDPGAFMDRSMLESDPFSIIEGMIIGGFAIGANKGFCYIRAEYPLAIERIAGAIEDCRAKGLLGKDILNTGFDFDIEIRLGAGAFVCGEETALINSIEGQRGQPRVRPPYPAVKGLWGKPTIINNVETFANIPTIITVSGKEFSQIGTEKSGGTKVFALAGKVSHTGLVEVPMGTTLGEVVYNIGGGVPDDKKLKAVQTGGPAGGFIPTSLIDTPIDYDTLAKMGSIMGSGGMIVLDEDDCMVDMAKFFLTFSQDESCGKCTPCREGTRYMLEILEKIVQGQGTEDDLEELEKIALLCQQASLCGLGRAAPNPILSSLREFRDEYIAHIKEKRCPAKKCKALARYEIDAEKCVGCTLCVKACPVDCISGSVKKPHKIDQSLCIKCENCFEVCRFDAVIKG